MKSYAWLRQSLIDGCLRVYYIYKRMMAAPGRHRRCRASDVATGLTVIAPL